MKTTQQTAWRASLDLRFNRDATGRSIPGYRRHEGPLMVQRPFHPEGDPCHVYILHPPGGVAGGDQLQINVAVEADAHALLTTPAAGKFYRSIGPIAQQVQYLNVSENGILEWLPQENIVFDQARIKLDTRVELSEAARCIGWELLTLGRKASGERFAKGSLEQYLQITRDGLPLLHERLRFNADDELPAAAWGLRGQTLTGVLYATPCDTAALETVRDIIQHSSEPVGVTLLDSLLVCRYLGNDVETARTLFTDIWAALRPLILSRPACPPRVWRT